MAYTPELNRPAAATLRRIAWSLNKPMTKTMNAIIIKLPKLMKKEDVCASCRDPSACNICGFNGNDAA
jgi:recombinational DNA repair protein RecR